jgi:hypothetical protein
LVWDTLCLCATLTLVFTIAWEICMITTPVLSLSLEFAGWLTYDYAMDAFFLIDIILRIFLVVKGPGRPRSESASVNVEDLGGLRLGDGVSFLTEDIATEVATRAPFCQCKGGGVLIVCLLSTLPIDLFSGLAGGPMAPLRLNRLLRIFLLNNYVKTITDTLDERVRFPPPTAQWGGERGRGRKGGGGGGEERGGAVWVFYTK